LFAVISLSVVSLFGLGWLASRFLLPRNARSMVGELPLVLTYGLLASYTLVLCLQSLRLSLFVSGLLALLGLGLFVFWVLSQQDLGQYFHGQPVVWIVAFVVLLAYALKILSDPLEAWDARSIWFFHAKMIYVEGALSRAAGWDLPTEAIFHFDYPKLVPVLAGQVAHLMGYWNEYLPKAALLLVLIAPVLWVSSFARRSFSFLLLICIFPFMLGSRLWDGYMDGYLAFYFAMALLLVGRYLEEPRAVDLISGLTCLAFAANLKNEGTLALVVGGVAIAATGFVAVKSGCLLLGQIAEIRWPQWLSLLAALTPFALWSYYRVTWGLPDDLQVGSVEPLARLLQRSVDGSSIRLILSRTLSEVWLPVVILAGSLAALRIARARLPLAALPALIAGVLYGLGIVVVYLMTPYDLTWHLTTSLDRTMLSVSSCFFVAIFWMIRRLERSALQGDSGVSEGTGL